MAIWSYLLSAILGGAMVPTQFGINVHLAGWLGGSVRAAFGHLASALTGSLRDQVP